MSTEASSGQGLCDRFAVADVDAHIIEPPDLWTSRVSSKWGDLVPHVKYHERRQEDIWYIGEQRLFGVAAFAQAAWPEFPPSHPLTMGEALPAAVDPKARLEYMDSIGVYYQVLYPNILGFHSHVFLDTMPRDARHRVRQGVQRLARGVRLGRYATAGAHDDAAVLGRRRIRGRDAALLRDWPQGRAARGAVRQGRAAAPRRRPLGAPARPGAGDGPEHQLPRRVPGVRRRRSAHRRSAEEARLRPGDVAEPARERGRTLPRSYSAGCATGTRTSTSCRWRTVRVGSRSSPRRWTGSGSASVHTRSTRNG